VVVPRNPGVTPTQITDRLRPASVTGEPGPQQRRRARLDQGSGRARRRRSRRSRPDAAADQPPDGGRWRRWYPAAFRFRRRPAAAQFQGSPRRGPWHRRPVTTAATSARGAGPRGSQGPAAGCRSCTCRRCGWSVRFGRLPGWRTRFLASNTPTGSVGSRRSPPPSPLGSLRPPPALSRPGGSGYIAADQTRAHPRLGPTRLPRARSPPVGIGHANPGR